MYLMTKRSAVVQSLCYANGLKWHASMKTREADDGMKSTRKKPCLPLAARCGHVLNGPCSLYLALRWPAVP